MLCIYFKYIFFYFDESVNVGVNGRKIFPQRVPALVMQYTPGL